MWPAVACALSGRRSRSAGCRAGRARLAITGADDQHGAEAAPVFIEHRLDIFGAIHRRRAQQPRRLAHPHQHIALIGKAHGRALRFGRAVGRGGADRDPAAAAAFFKARAIKLALVEQVHVGGAVRRIKAPARHEFVHKLVALIVAHVNRHAPVLGERGGGAFVFLAAKRGALFRGGRWIIGIDVHDPAIGGRAVRVFATRRRQDEFRSHPRVGIAERKRVSRERLVRALGLKIAGGAEEAIVKFSSAVRYVPHGSARRRNCQRAAAPGVGRRGAAAAIRFAR